MDQGDQKLLVRLSLIMVIAGSIDQLAPFGRRQLVPLLQRELDSRLVELHSDAHRDAAQRATEVDLEGKDTRVGR
jgi:hypothetical protein